MLESRGQGTPVPGVRGRHGCVTDKERVLHPQVPHAHTHRRPAIKPTFIGRYGVSLLNTALPTHPSSCARAPDSHYECDWPGQLFYYYE